MNLNQTGRMVDAPYKVEPATLLRGNLGGCGIQGERPGLWKRIADWIWRKTQMDAYVLLVGLAVIVACLVAWRVM